MLGRTPGLATLTLPLTMPWSPPLYFEHLRKADFASRHSCGDKLERGEWAHSLFDFMDEPHFQYSGLGKSSGLLIRSKGRVSSSYATKMGFLRAGLHDSSSPSTLPQVERSLCSPAAFAHVLCPAGLVPSAEPASKDIFLKVSLCGVQEPTYLGAYPVLKL